MDFDNVRALAEATLAGMRQMPYEPTTGFKNLYPSMWCEWAAIGIATILEANELGGWTFVQASRPGEGHGHAWLELRAVDGTVLYSIDATLDQFSNHSERFIGPGGTPAATEFTEVKYEGPWRSWPILEYKPIYVTFADETLRDMTDAVRN